MSKRMCSESTPPQQESKKIKVQQDDHPIIIKLTTDEFSCILPYLEIGEVLMLSMVCKSIHQMLVNYFQNIHPYYFHHKSEWTIGNESSDHKSEWTIGNALKTVRLMVIDSSYSYDCANRILNRIIDQNETLSRFSTRFKVENLNFPYVFNLLSKPTNQAMEKVVHYKFESMKDEYFHDVMERSEISIKKLPIGFHIKELNIDMMISVSQLYQLLTQCHSLEKLSISIQPMNIPKSESFSIPIFESLKYLSLPSIWNNEEVIYNLLRLAPNLEFFEFKYYVGLDDKFLSFLSKHCPKLKGISISVHENSRPYELLFTDEGLANFLKQQPKLEYLKLSPCSQISGSFYSKLDHSNNLRYLCIDRQNYETHLIPQIASITIPEGSLQSLEVFEKDFNYSFSPNNGKLFMESFLKAAPNIRDIGNVASTDGINLEHYFDQLCSQLTVFPQFPHKETKKSNIYQLWLEKSTILKEVDLDDPMTHGINLFKLNPIPSVEILTVSIIGASEMKELCRVFPSVKEFNYSTASPNVIQALTESLKDGRWPHLRVLDVKCLNEEIVQLRPLIYGIDKNFIGQHELMKSSTPLHDEKAQFEKEWLVLDRALSEYHTSEMIRFFKS